MDYDNTAPLVLGFLTNFRNKFKEFEFNGQRVIVQVKESTPAEDYFYDELEYNIVNNKKIKYNNWPALFVYDQLPKLIHILEDFEYEKLEDDEYKEITWPFDIAVETIEKYNYEFQLLEL